MKTSGCVCLGIFFALAAWASPLIAADDPVPESATSDSAEVAPDEIAATVNEEPITMGQVADAVKQITQGRSTSNAATERMLQAEVLSQLIDQALVRQMLEKSGKPVSDEDVTKAIDELKKKAEEQKIDFAKVMAGRGISEDKLREDIAWQLNWGKYLRKTLTDTNLRKFFEAHKRDFDGTELRVSHILLRPDGPGSMAETERLGKMAMNLRAQIESGKRTFESAAKQLSAGPSRHKGGDLGFIPRQGLMLEQFSNAAFQLEKGKISDPVATAYGVHLIKVTDVKPGKKRWSEVKELLQQPVAKEVFDQVAAKERETAKIDYTDKCPHFKPGTKELASE